MAEPLTICKLMVLTMLQYASMPLSSTKLSDFILGGDYTNYFTLREALQDLEDDALVKAEETHSNTRYAITPAGVQTLSLLSDRLSPDIQDDIRAYLRDKHMEIREDDMTLANYYKTDDERYAVRCQLKERGRTRLDLTVDAPDRKAAEAVCANWKKQSMEVYAYLMDLLMA